MTEAQALDAFPRIEVERRAGVPVFWADAPGPKQVALAFRVGRADEVLAQFGLSHAVEHLAMFPLGRPDYMCNAFVDDTRTVFFAEGTEMEIARFLERVCASLRELPLDRLDAERRVLQTEAANDPGSPLERLFSLRYGPSGFGLSNYRQLGLRWLGADRIAKWAAERFTSGNAAAWMTCRPPENLDLALPPGEPLPPPEPVALPNLETPAYVAEGAGRASLAYVARRSAGIVAASTIAAERAHERLRVDQGISYGVEGSYIPMTAKLAHGHLGADCLDEHAGGVLQGINRAVGELSASGPSDEELTRYKQLSLRGMSQPESAPGALDNAVTRQLFGEEERTPAQIAAELRDLEPSVVMEAMREALTTAIMVAPEGLPAPPPGFVPYSAGHGERIEGRVFRAKRQGLRRPKERYVLGDGGVALGTPDEEPVAIRFAGCVAVIEEVPAAYGLVDRDGSFVRIAPAYVDDGDELVAAVRANVPEDLFVPPPRSATAVEELAAQLPKRSLVEVELGALAEQLGEEEMPLALAEASRGLKVGLLAATDRRVVWLFNGRKEFERLEFSYEQLQRVTYDEKDEKSLLLTTYPENVRFTDVKPPAAGRGLAAAIQERVPRPA